MKTLILVRHGKSSWKDNSLDDIERPLKMRGKEDALLMAKLAVKMKLKPQLMLSSPAVRAYATANIFAEQFNFPEEQIFITENLYLASRDEIIDVIKDTDDSFESAMLFGHNPGLTDAAVYLTGTIIENVPTSAFVVMQLKEESWQTLGNSACTLTTFEYPKKYK